jgi:hypothetical protein
MRRMLDGEEFPVSLHDDIEQDPVVVYFCP